MHAKYHQTVIVEGLAYAHARTYARVCVCACFDCMESQNARPGSSTALSVHLSLQKLLFWDIFVCVFVLRNKRHLKADIPRCPSQCTTISVVFD